MWWALFGINSCLQLSISQQTGIKKPADFYSNTMMHRLLSLKLNNGIYTFIRPLAGASALYSIRSENMGL